MHFQEYEKSRDAYRQTIHKPLPKEDIRVPEAKLQASTDAASEQFKKLKMTNVSTKDEVSATLVTDSSLTANYAVHLVL